MTEQQDKKICCIQLDVLSSLTEKQNEAVAELIYDTDEYIYPALFGAGTEGRRKAAVILPAAFESGRDAMFRKDNLYLAMSGDSVVGLILWYRGPLDWTPDWILSYAGEKGLALNRADVGKVAAEYVSERYAEDTAADPAENEAISVINVCVRKDCRGQGIAKIMMTAFIEAHRQEPMELTVLADNPPAVELYKKMGFRITEELPGFSLEQEKPDCYIMEREAGSVIL